MGSAKDPALDPFGVGARDVRDACLATGATRCRHALVRTRKDLVANHLDLLGQKISPL